MNRTIPASLMIGLAWVMTGPAWAQSSPPPEVMDEVIVTAPRNGEPDFQEADDFHRKEYLRLRAKFDKQPPAPPRGDQSFATGGASATGNDQNSGRDQVRNAPRLRDTFSND